MWPDEQRYFFDVVLASKDAWGAAFCCGTSSVIRFSELQRLGGFPTDSVTEDYLVTLRMKQGGYRTVYLNERLSLGLAPEGLKEYITQRSRWALGFMQIFRGPLGPLRRGNGLSVIDRVSLIEAFLYWFGSYAFRMLGIIVPILYLLLNVNAVQADVATTLSYYVPHFVASSIATGWMAQSRVMPIMTDVTQLLAGSQILQAVAHGLTQAEGPEIQGHRQGRRPQPAHGAMAAAQHVPALSRADHRRRGVGVPDRGRNQAARLQRAVPVLELVQYDRADHRLHGVHRAAALPLGRTAVRGRGGDGARGRHGFGPSRAGSLARRVRGCSAHPTPPAGSTITMAFEGLNLPATVVRCGARDFAVRFEDVGAARTDLIKFVYSGRYSAAIERIEPRRVAAAILGRVMR